MDQVNYVVRKTRKALHFAMRFLKLKKKKRKKKEKKKKKRKMEETKTEERLAI
jgi:hypothetical protein